jgi:hypothetical protein
MGAVFSSSKAPIEPQRPSVSIIVEDVQPSTSVRNFMSPKPPQNLNRVVPFNSSTMGTTMQLNLKGLSAAGTSSNWQQSNNNNVS